MASVIKQSDFAVDKYDLDGEWVRQPTLYGRYARLAADARRDYEDAKAALDTVKAELGKSIRSDPGSYDLPKVTESALASTILLQPEYQQAVEEVNECRHKMDVLNGGVSALDHKKTALVKLVDLHLADYFSTPRPSSESAEFVDEMEQRAARRRARIKNRGGD